MPCRLQRLGRAIGVMSTETQAGVLQEKCSLSLLRHHQAGPQPRQRRPLPGARHTSQHPHNGVTEPTVPCKDESHSPWGNNVTCLLSEKSQGPQNLQTSWKDSTGDRPSSHGHITNDGIKHGHPGNRLQVSTLAWKWNKWPIYTMKS